MRLVTALASKGNNLAETMKQMNAGLSGRSTMLQTLTTRDVVMYRPVRSIVWLSCHPPRDNGTEKTIYQRLVEEIHHAGKHEARGRSGGNPHFQTSAFRPTRTVPSRATPMACSKPGTDHAQAAGDGLASGRDGNGHRS